jgi:hypothetical protein
MADQPRERHPRLRRTPTRPIRYGNWVKNTVPVRQRHVPEIKRSIT